MKKTIILFLFSITLAHAGEKENSWTPEVEFQFEDSNYIETLIWVSGNSYAYSEIGKTQTSSFCLPKNDIIGSKVILDILNSKFKGKKINSEQASSAIFYGIQERFPCK